MNCDIYIGNCLEVMRGMEADSVDAVVTDPPYGLSFMNKKWDYEVPSVEIWGECLRLLKPGGYLLSFAGTRTYHRIACGIEDAGFELRDMIAWVYGSGFPKSLNIGKAVDKIQGNEREVVGVLEGTGCYDNQQRKNKDHGFRPYENGLPCDHANKTLTKGTSDWEGWGTALKPAFEPIALARKPLSEKTVAENVLKWGTGGLNIDKSRVAGKLEGDPDRFQKTDGGEFIAKFNIQPVVRNEGRFPANFIHDGSEEVLELFPETKSGSRQGGDIYKLGRFKGMSGARGLKTGGSCNSSSGSASRFFYCAKASKAERNKGCEGLEEKPVAYGNQQTAELKKGVPLTPNGGVGKGGVISPQRNNHPTVKPVALMEYLIKLVSKEGATILDPFMGSGSTGVACKRSGRKFIGIEQEEDYCKIAKCRIMAEESQRDFYRCGYYNPTL